MDKAEFLFLQQAQLPLAALSQKHSISICIAPDASLENATFRNERSTIFISRPKQSQVRGFMSKLKSVSPQIFLVSRYRLRADKLRTWSNHARVELYLFISCGIVLVSRRLTLRFTTKSARSSPADWSPCIVRVSAFRSSQRFYRPAIEGIDDSICFVSLRRHDTDHINHKASSCRQEQRVRPEIVPRAPHA